ncbi:MAG: RseA family anti-sigma factor [Telluria sp.]
MDTLKKIREHVSALSDGELRSSDLELALAALQGADGQHAWNTYFRIGDELRAQATPQLSDGFAARLAERLDAEPAPVAVAGKRAAAATTAMATSTLDGAQAEPSAKPAIAGAS